MYMNNLAYFGRLQFWI